jgi:predicted nucleic acid-binding protein
MSVDFIDSNVFVYLVDEADPTKRAVSRGIVDEALSSNSGVISFQVVQETLNVLTRKLKVIANAEDVIDFMRQVLQPLWKVQPSAPLDAKAMGLQQRYAFSFYDSLIVAAALEGGCKRLLTEDLFVTRP